ncbi:MAG TPA: tripartite tricarboxylate transporter substrate binding protein [Xanthobacteraceae bacterium]|nr:tripartite tricarboxylate transporter substrate binding protein [Xanthobacteraceae bacterium]
MKRRMLGAVLSLLALTIASHAQDYPNRLIKLMHGFPPGGNIDVVARLLAQDLSKALGQTIVVEGKPGPGGNLAAEAVAAGDPDGYTLLLVAGLHPAVAAVYKKLKYRPVDDFAWISTASFYPFIVCVRKDSALKNMADLLRAARANPGGVTSGTAGVGSIAHMTTELIANQAGVKLLSVPYRGEAPAMTGLLSGDVNLVVATTTLAAPHIRSGEVRALAVTGKTRWKDFPDLPTMAESGLADIEVISWSGLAAPANTPQPIVQRLNAEVQRVIAAPELRARLESFGAEVRGTTPAEMRELVERQVALWTKVAKAANIQLD